jgi:hypothetical protein
MLTLEAHQIPRQRHRMGPGIGHGLEGANQLQLEEKKKTQKKKILRSENLAGNTLEISYNYSKKIQKKTNNFDSPERKGAAVTIGKDITKKNLTVQNEELQQEEVSRKSCDGGKSEKKNPFDCVEPQSKVSITIRS